jgi:hypothetical protein
MFWLILVIYIFGIISWADMLLCHSEFIHDQPRSVLFIGAFIWPALMIVCFVEGLGEIMIFVWRGITIGDQSRPN